MPVKIRDAKILWARAAGRCSKPKCHADLIPILTKRGSVVLGEMAHVIGRKQSAARSKRGVATDDSYENLILLCPTHHTLVDKSEGDFPASHLRKWKRDWEGSIQRKLLPIVSTEGGNKIEMRIWSYFNFRLLVQLQGKLGTSLPDTFSILQARRLADSNGFPIEGTADGSRARTIFDTWSYAESHWSHHGYSELVEKLLRAGSLLDADAFWGVRRLKALLYPSALIFINRRCYFRVIDKNGLREERRVTCQGQGVRLIFQINTWNAYSSSALTLHFRGCSRIAAWLMVRSIESTPSGILEIKATPVALGTGFWTAHHRKPMIAYRNEATHDFVGEDE